MKNFKHLMTFESYSILGRVETVTITNEEGETVTCNAKIDTGSYSSRISADIAKQLKLPVIDKKKIKSALGEEDRTFVELQFNIAGVEIKTIAGIADMEDLRNEVAIGRKDIGMVDGLVDVKKKNNEPIGIPLDVPVEVELEVEPTEVKESLNESKQVDVKKWMQAHECTPGEKYDVLFQKYMKKWDSRWSGYWGEGTYDEGVLQTALDYAKEEYESPKAKLDKYTKMRADIIKDLEKFVEEDDEEEGEKPTVESLNENVKIEITKNEPDYRSNRIKNDTYHVNYSFTMDEDEKEIEGILNPYGTGRATDYEFEPDYYTDDETEEYYDENWEEIRDEIMEEFYKK